MIAAPQHEIKSADAVIAEDVICQSFIQSSCTLAYACLLIRRRRFELAAHVLHSLEAKQASRFKDMVFYLQAQIGIETGEYMMVKKRLVPRVNQHPNDMVALSLLETSIYHEFAENAPESPAPVSEPRSVSGFGNAEAASAAALAASFAPTRLPPEEPVAPAVAGALADPAPIIQAPSPVPTAAKAAPAVQALSAHQANGVQPGYVEIALASLPSAPASGAALGRDGSRGHRAGASGDADMGLSQGIANDPNTQALGLWGKQRTKIFCRSPELEPLMAMLMRELPGSLQDACGTLDAGPIHKVCFSFQHLTISSFHAGGEAMAHVTGPLNQNLLSIVRAENTFKKTIPGGSAAHGGPGAVSGFPATGGSAASGAQP
jgi:hypothetical protein